MEPLPKVGDKVRLLPLDVAAKKMGLSPAHIKYEWKVGGILHKREPGDILEVASEPIVLGDAIYICHEIDSSTCHISTKCVELVTESQVRLCTCPREVWMYQGCKCGGK